MHAAVQGGTHICMASAHLKAPTSPRVIGPRHRHQSPASAFAWPLGARAAAFAAAAGFLLRHAPVRHVHVVKTTRPTQTAKKKGGRRATARLCSTMQSSAIVFQVCARPMLGSRCYCATTGDGNSDSTTHPDQRPPCTKKSATERSGRMRTATVSSSAKSGMDRDARGDAADFEALALALMLALADRVALRPTQER